MIGDTPSLQVNPNPQRKDWSQSRPRIVFHFTTTTACIPNGAMDTQTKGLLITTLGVLCVVPDSLFVRLIDAPPLVISFWRGLIAGSAVLAGVLIMQGTAPLRAVLRTGRYGIAYMLAAGASGILFVLAVSLTSVANVVLIIASMPLFAAIFSRILLGEPITRRMLLTMAAVAVGLGVIAYGSGETRQGSLAGDAIALLVSAVFAAGLTAARRVREVSMVPAVGLGYVGASLLLWPFIAPLSVPSAQVWLVPLHGGFIVVSSALLALGPRYITSAEVALLILLESVLAPLLAWAVVAEHPGRWSIAGGAIVVGALAVSNIVALMRQRVKNSSRPRAG